MKSREELETIARDIVEKKGWFIPDDENHLGLIDDISEALTRVQDEALNSVLPSSAEVSTWTTVFAQERLDKDGYRANEWETTTAFMKWLRANMKTAPQERCPCGGTILADTDEYRTPLCNECYEQVLGSVKPVPQLPNEENRYETFKRHCSETPVKVGFRNLSVSNRWMSEEGDVWRSAWSASRANMKPAPHMPNELITELLKRWDSLGEYKDDDFGHVGEIMEELRKAQLEGKK